jgi:hypothetical protein
MVGPGDRVQSEPEPRKRVGTADAFFSCQGEALLQWVRATRLHAQVLQVAARATRHQATAVQEKARHATMLALALCREHLGLITHRHRPTQEHAGAMGLGKGDRRRLEGASPCQEVR